MRTNARLLTVVAALVVGLVWAVAERPAEAMKIRPLHDHVLVKVVDTNDPDGLGRIRVAFPVMPEPSASGMRFRTEWARLLLPAGGPAGTSFLPEVDDEVLVGFEQGDTARPVILGRLWDGRTPPSPSDRP
jgi:uncharacterized protein involved in type VI secretion and phage assembly